MSFLYFIGMRDFQFNLRFTQNRRESLASYTLTPHYAEALLVYKTQGSKNKVCCIAGYQILMLYAIVGTNVITHFFTSPFGIRGFINHYRWFCTTCVSFVPRIYSPCLYPNHVCCRQSHFNAPVGSSGF
jgi:hypothetical protein